MTTQATYDATGQILSTLSPNIITDPNQIAALTVAGISLVIIPDGKNGATGSIVNGVYQDYPPIIPIPNPLFQLISALINNNVISASSFHPTTISQLNVALTAASMLTINTIISPAS